METCVVLAQQRTHCGYRNRYASSSGRRKAHAPGCQPSYHYGAGLLPTPSTKSQPQPSKTSPIPIPKTTSAYENGLTFGNTYSERWAGPTYSSSPPPSSVPIPKFSAVSSTPTRTVSLELPVIDKEVVYIHPLAKSAPCSPRKSRLSAKQLFGTADNNATKALRRILNLDMCDE